MARIAILLALLAPGDAEFDAAVGKDFWGVVSVVRDDKTVFAKGYGMADRKAKPNTPRTLFDLASVSKQFTAAAIFKLEQGKKLSVSDSIGKHLTGVPKQQRAITIYHLLTHTSGLPEKIPGLTMAVALDREAFSQAMTRARLQSRPGKRWTYSNKGYCLLAVIIERASGMKFESYLKKHLFEPAGMGDTGFYGDRDLDASRLSVRGESGDARTWPWDWSMRGSAGVVSTAEDLVKWDRALRKMAFAKMYEPFLQGVACGWMVGRIDKNGRPLWVFHTGRVHGYQAYFARWLTTGQALIVLTDDKTDPSSLHGPLLAAAK